LKNGRVEMGSELVRMWKEVGVAYTIITFVWKNQRRPQKVSVCRVGLPDEIRPETSRIQSRRTVTFSDSDKVGEALAKRSNFSLFAFLPARVT
jgi:hypothetical protein